MNTGMGTSSPSARTLALESVLVPCESIAPGMFPSERYVTVCDDVAACSLGMFVDSHAIEETHGATWLRVTQMEIDPLGDVAVCLLPVAATETVSGTRWLRVRRARLASS